jgi:6-phosphogluconolactonase
VTDGVHELDIAGTRVMVFGAVPMLLDAVHTELLSVAAAAFEAREGFSIALAGGSTPAELYRRLAEPGGGLNWSAVDLFFGDERHVPPSHPDSNYRMAHETFLRPASVPADRVHRIEAELPASEAAARYEAEIRRVLGAPAGVPLLDLVLLGLGEDAHTASLFPHSSMLEETTRLVTSGRVPRLDAERITMTYPLLNAARDVWFLVTGERKADAVARVLSEDAPVTEAPARGVAGSCWWLDEPAAANLQR